VISTLKKVPKLPVGFLPTGKKRKKEREIPTQLTVLRGKKVSESISSSMIPPTFNWFTIG
jgi:hypothetical protein